MVTPSRCKVKKTGRIIRYVLFFTLILRRGRYGKSIYGGQSVTRDMRELKGQIVKIRHVDELLYDMSSCYMIEGSTWGWTNEMFIPLDIDADKAFSMLVNDELSEESYKQIIES